MGPLPSRPRARARSPTRRPVRENPPWGECRRAVGDLLGNLVKATSVENGLTLPDITRGQLLTLLRRLCTEYDWPLDEDRRVFIGREDWRAKPSTTPAAVRCGTC